MYHKKSNDDEKDDDNEFKISKQKMLKKLYIPFNNISKIISDCSIYRRDVLLACTRFTTSTWTENIRCRMNNKISSLYGTDIRIREKYPSFISIVVMEMNNETNKIMGVGIIRNRLVFDLKYGMYKNQNFNRYIYSGSYWSSHYTLNKLCPDLIDKLERMLFKGRGHMKRLTGISVLSEKFLRGHELNEMDVIKTLVRTFPISDF
jgi:hypothetical protein